MNTANTFTADRCSKRLGPPQKNILKQNSIKVKQAQQQQQQQHIWPDAQEIQHPKRDAANLTKLDYLISLLDK